MDTIDLLTKLYYNIKDLYKLNGGIIMKSYSELRAMSREQLKGHWGISLLVCLIFSLIIGGTSIIPFAPLILGGPLTLGLVYYFVNLSRGEEPKFDSLFSGFDSFGKSLGLYLLQGLFIFLWSLLLIIPGIIAQYRYAMTFYLLKDNPEIGINEALSQSCEMMKGYKWKYFVLSLTFIGWYLLSCLTLGIGFLWLIPYMLTTQANFYNELKQLKQPEVAPQIETL